MSQYYFLATALPPLRFGVIPDINFDQFVDLLNDNLASVDLAKTQIIRLFYDIQNIKAFWKGEKLDPRGNLNAFELEEALLTRDWFPAYVFDFLDTFENHEERLKNFTWLTAAYFRMESKRAVGFLRSYLHFEWEIRLVIAAFRAKKLNRDLLKELQFEDPKEDIVAQIIAQKDSKFLLPPDGYQELIQILEENFDRPLELHKSLNEYLFREVEKFVAIDLFSIDRILGYMVRLIALEKWLELDQASGMKRVCSITEGI